MNAKTMTYHQNILCQLSRLMKQHDLNPSELARRTGIPQPTIHRLLHNEHLDPRFSTLSTLARFFDVSIDFFLGKQPKQTDTESYTIPIYSLTNIHLHWSEQHIAAHTLIAACPNAECYAIEGSLSMQPKVPEGALVIMNPHKKPHDGDIVLVYYQQEKLYAMRVYVKDGPTHLLRTISLGNTPESITDNTNIVSVAMQITTLL